MKLPIQIKLQSTGGNAYIMKYPETVNVELQLSRSSQWWGVFLSVVETFKAIKEDRLYLIDVFNEWYEQGFSNTYKLSIEISINEFEQWTIIYTGYALPDYKDDTLYFSTKFEESSYITKFLDGNSDIKRPFNTFGSIYQFGFNNIQNLWSVINAVNQEHTLINQSSFLDGLSLSNALMPNGIDTVSVYNKDFSNATGKTAYFDYITKTNIPSQRSYFWDNNRIVLPKWTDLILYLDLSINDIGTDVIIPYFEDQNGILYVPDNFDMALGFNESIFAHDRFDWGLKYSTQPNRGYYLIDNESDISNISDDRVFINLWAKLSNDTSPSYLYNPKITYPAIEGQIFSQQLKIIYKGLTDFINDMRLFDIVRGNVNSVSDIPIIQDNINNSRIEQVYNNFSLIPFDGPSQGTNSNVRQSQAVVTLNKTEVLKEIQKALSIGLTVEQSGSNKFLSVKYIPDLFENVESINIDESNIFSFSESLNTNLKIGKIILGANNRDFNYFVTKYDQSLKTTYSANNSFTGTLDLSLNTYRSQMFDFVDIYKNYFFNERQEDKNDADFVLFHKESVNQVQDYRFNLINGAITPVSQVCAWSWLLQVISPDGFTTTGDDNYTIVQSPIVAGQYRSLTNNIESSNDAFTEVAPVITLKKFNIECKLTAIQYKSIIDNRNRYLTINYKGSVYKGYINNLTIKVGKTILASIEMLEKYQS